MECITDYGYYGFTYVQEDSPPCPSNRAIGETWLKPSEKRVYVKKTNTWECFLEECL